ncbi:hypothetical protein J1614_011536 [Plenodomus biglobosus]|nr:hypothetical protein J1614_011536 [Plenodomus biglobosus]
MKRGYSDDMCIDSCIGVITRLMPWLWWLSFDRLMQQVDVTGSYFLKIAVPSNIDSLKDCELDDDPGRHEAVPERQCSIDITYGAGRELLSNDHGRC